jgi:hypothetical protein
METIIIKDAPLLKKNGRNKGQKTLDFFAELDKLEPMDLLTVKNEKPYFIANLVYQYKKIHRRKHFRTLRNGDEVMIQRIKSR